jgi:hypothetical protein
MAATNSAKLQKKKRELEQEINKIEYLLDDSINKVKSDISSFDPRAYVRQKPLPIVGAAVLLGVLLGVTGRKNEGEKKAPNEPPLSAALWSEIKRVAVRKMVAKAGDYLEDLLAEL